MRKAIVTILASAGLLLAGCTSSAPSEEDIKNSDNYKQLQKELESVKDSGSKKDKELSALQSKIQSIGGGMFNTVYVDLSQVTRMEGQASSLGVSISNAQITFKGQSLEPGNTGAPVRTTGNEYAELSLTINNTNSQPVFIASPVVVDDEGTGYFPLNGNYLYIDSPVFDPLGKAFEPNSSSDYKIVYELPDSGGDYTLKHCGISGNFNAECTFLDIEEATQ